MNPPTNSNLQWTQLILRLNLDVYNHLTIDGTQTSVDGGAAELTDLVLAAADASLKQKEKEYNSKQTKHMAWINLDLHKMRINLINYGQIYSKHHNDLSVKIQYRGITTLQRKQKI